MPFPKEENVLTMKNSVEFKAFSDKHNKRTCNHCPKLQSANTSWEWGQHTNFFDLTIDGYFMQIFFLFLDCDTQM